MKDKFIKALENNDLDGIKSVFKSDLHNHATRGGNIKFIEEWSKTAIENPPKKYNDLSDMQCWYDKNIKPLCKGQVGFIKRIEAAFSQAVQDGVTVLCMSFGTGDKIHFNTDLRYYVNTIDKIHKSIAPDINFIPEICFSRTNNIEPIEKDFDEIINLNYFKSIDLVGDDTKPVDNFKNIYRKAKENGYILKAHVGEFGDAESIRKAVEALELQQVQHGISAIKSKDVMKWLATNKIQLNICPSSNVMLSRVEDYSHHPIKELYYNGIPVTINTDDMLIFNQSLSDDYLNLFNVGLLSAHELNEIRETGLKL